MASDPIDILKQAYRGVRKSVRQARLARTIGPVNRIDRVAPPQGRRLVAMTFDDGPCRAPLRPGDGELTATLLETLEKHGARGTFDVIGTTAHNYPDIKGKDGWVFWSGTRFDHYPEFGRDALAGVANQPDLARRMASEGHELSNHSFTHTAFGPNGYPSRPRRYLPGLQAVVADLKTQHDLVLEVTGREMRFGRPPHYVDNTADGKSAYDAYAVLDYFYLGASFDGGGWARSSGDYQADVEAAVRPLEAALANDPEALNGQIIFEKDGYNMSTQSPVAEILGRHLASLERHGYEVVTVSELLSVSPFTDIGLGHPVFGPARALAERGHLVTYIDNRVRPDQLVTAAEVALMFLPAGARARWSTRTSTVARAIGDGGAEGVLLVPRLASTGTGSAGSADGALNNLLTPQGLGRICLEHLRLRSARLGPQETGRRESLIKSRSAQAGTLSRGRAIGLLGATLVGV